MRLSSIIIVLLLTLSMSGCGTAVNVKTLKSADVDMSSMRRLAVLDFAYYKGSINSLEEYILSTLAESINVNYGDDYEAREAASYATSKLLIVLNDTNYFNIVTPVTIRNLRHADTVEIKGLGDALALRADAVLIPEISYAGCKQVPFFREERVYDEIQKQKITLEIPWVQQHCRLAISYRVVSTADNTLIAIEHYSEEREEEIEEESFFNLNTPEYQYRQMIDTLIPRIARKLAPYVTSETRYLKKDESYDPDMERAIALAEAGDLFQARSLFLKRWRATANPAAGYNAVILYQADGNLEEAFKLLREMITITNDSDILSEYKRVLQAMAEKRRVEEQMR